MYVRRAGFEAATSPPWPEAQAVVEAVFHRWPPLSKTTTCHGRRAGERGEQASAKAQPRARALSPHGQPVRRAAGSEKVLATRHLLEKTRQESQVESLVFSWRRGFGPLLAYLRLPGRILDQYLDESIPAWELLVQSPQTASETDH